jgi:hypothetical protein
MKAWHRCSLSAELGERGRWQEKASVNCSATWQVGPTMTTVLCYVFVVAV